MLEKTARIFSENLARAMDRRGFVKRVGQTTFAGMAALAAGHAMPMVAKASGVQPSPILGSPQCAPPGPYCSIDGNPLSGCHGGSCFEQLYNGEVIQCRLWYIYQAGCWTTPVQGGYWTCCDCECFQNGVRVTSCGCAQYSGSPQPRPDRAGGSPIS